LAVWSLHNIACMVVLGFCPKESCHIHITPPVCKLIKFVKFAS
jgi:hypothetical protein